MMNVFHEMVYKESRLYVYTVWIACQEVDDPRNGERVQKGDRPD